MKRWVALFMVLAAFSAEVCAVTVFGSRPCGGWVSDRQNGGSSKLAAEAWLMGYLSGLASASEVDFMEGADAASMILWADNYCHANPLSYAHEAGKTLFFELEAKKNTSH